MRMPLLAAILLLATRALALEAELDLERAEVRALRGKLCDELKAPPILLRQMH